MQKLDELIKSTPILAKEYNLYRPNFERSVVGVLPEIISHLNYDIELPGSTVRNNNVAKHIQNSFPSGYKNAIFIIADGVGAQHLSNIGGMFASNINHQGTVASTVFPSMTSTVMSSLSLGQFPSAHGVMGYNIYNEKIDDVWSTLAMKYMKEEKEYPVLNDYELTDLIHGESLIRHIKDIANPFISPAQLGEPSLIDLILPSYPVIKYNEVSEAVKLIMNHTQLNKFTAFYYPAADHMGHHHGPESAEYQQAIAGLDHVLIKLMELPQVEQGDTAIFVTSDHGQSQIDHSISTWMNKEEWKRYKNEGVILSTSGRTIHAYCEDHAMDRGKELLERFANGRGMVIDNNLAMELAGKNHMDAGFANRMGDYVMIAEERYLYDIPERVIYDGDDRLHGQHGSLSTSELFVPVGIFGGNS